MDETKEREKSEGTLIKDVCYRDDCQFGYVYFSFVLEVAIDRICNA